MRKQEVYQILKEVLLSVRHQSPPSQFRSPSSSPQHFSRTSAIHDDKIIKITNDSFIKRREQYTHFLKRDLDARDQEIIIPFCFVVDLSRFQSFLETQKGRYSEMIKDSNPQSKKKVGHQYIESIKFTNSQEYDRLLREIQDFLSNVCENVTSITFRLLNEGKLTDNQAKAFASKNFIINIHSLMIQMKNAVKYFTKEEEIEDIIAKITTEIDESMMKVLESMLEHYPQAPAVGETARMREIIVNVNQSQDQSYDLIYSRGIKIQQYLKLDYGQVINGYENYTGFIMEVINSAINVTREYLSDEEEVSVFEKFVQFSQRLFCTSQHKHFKEILKHNREKNDKLVNYYLKVMAGEEIEIKDVKDIQKDRRKLSPAECFEVVKAEFDESLEKMRESHKYAIAQKIPNYVMPFSRNQLKANKFSINSSAILRIMTKWAQNLEEIFKKPELYIKQRLYNYKNITNDLFAPSKEINDQLYQKLIKEYESVKQQFNKLKQQNKLLQSYILSHNEAGIDTYLKRFTQVRSASSQINASLIQIMHKYLCILIHHLMKAGEKIDTGSNWENINLVVFRVNDLLRSKFQCTETTFINVLNTLSLLDKSKQMEGKLKLVRVKNKLNQKDNNILINYMFLGKVQCQLQLSIQDMKGKQKNYYDFNHFIYQLIRGKFGVITECAIIVSQHDSTVNSCRDEYYKPKKYKRKKPLKENYDEENGIQFKKVHQKDSSLFVCNKCKQLMVNHNIDLFNCKENICNQCLMVMQQPEEKLKYQKLRRFLCTNLGKGVTKIKNYSEIKHDKYILTLSTTGKTKDTIKLFRAWNNEKQFKLFLLQINKQILSTFESNQFSYEEFNYMDIKPLQEKKATLKQPTYLVEKQSLEEMFVMLSIDEELLVKLDALIEKFQDYRIQKNLIKSIKFKQEIIDLSTDHKKLNKFDQILEAEINKEKSYLIRYDKYKNLQYNNLKTVYITQLNLQSLPPNLSFLTDLHQINLEDNQLTKLDFSPFSKLRTLNVNKNQLTEIDVSCLANLSHLKLSDNQLTSLDLSKNNNLTELAVENNQLKTVQFWFHPRLEATLNDQRSQQCQVHLLFKSAEAEACLKLQESMSAEYVEQWRNKNACDYVFQTKEAP